MGSSPRRFGPYELAGLAIFLASPASSILTGVTIAADAGYSAT